MSKHVEVAAAVLLRGDGRVLLGQRAPDTFFPGYWEFPGGKVEAGETPREALVRELAEELGIEVRRATPWITRRHAYEHAHVTLRFFIVSDWHGEVNDHVHSALQWEDPQAFGVAPMLPANGPILKSLTLPRTMGVTQAASIGIEAQLRGIEAALARGLRLIQIREPAALAAQFAPEMVARAHACGARVVVNDNAQLARACGADGLHLKAASLAVMQQRPDFEWVGASCHSRADLERAAGLGLDYALLGSLKATPSHPGQAALGWPAFAAMVADLPLPVFAIGGLSPCDLDVAQTAGAHGIAMIRGAWQQP